ncbi:MAG TPA: lysozyme [Novosphingobium sp.]|nr:lysozyme [Novosphingobium sp.]
MKRKPIFDAVRKLLGRGFGHDEVAALDRAIDLACSETLPTRGLGEAGLALIKHWEGCARRRADSMIQAYPDPGTGGPPWTIGWGTTGADITPGLVWTQAQCDVRLAADLRRFVAEVARAIGDAPTTANQFDALVSFHYNTGAIAKATLTRRHKAGDFAGAQAEFGKWVHAGGRVMRGLVKRRAEEATLYASG